MQFDYDRAFELAVLFDEEKSIPPEHNIKSVLELFTDPALDISQKLDLVILYLRRVHFFCYYLGKRFHDEAHLTAVAPNILFRIRVPKLNIDEGEQTTEDLNPESKTFEEKIEEFEEKKEESDEKKEGVEVVPLVDLEKPYSGRNDPSVENLDR